MSGDRRTIWEVPLSQLTGRDRLRAGLRIGLAGGLGTAAGGLAIYIVAGIVDHPPATTREVVAFIGKLLLVVMAPIALAMIILLRSERKAGNQAPPEAARAGPRRPS